MMNLTEMIIAEHAGMDFVKPGDEVWANVDTLMMHDVTSTGAIKALREQFDNKIAERLKVVVVPDHFIPAKDAKSANLYKELIDFAREHDLEHVYPLGENYGVCHVMLPQEGHVLPGDLVVGGDSHTCAYGSVGAFSTGVGTTDAACVLAKGVLWFKVPETYLFHVENELPGNVMAKDLFLHVVGNIGTDGALYEAMEWTGSGIRNMCQDERDTLTNMAIEAGAKSGIIHPDGVTAMYFAKKGIEIDINRFKVDNAVYSRAMDVDASKIVPLVARPHIPSNVALASELSDIAIDQAYVGGCTGGKWEDMLAAAEVLKGKHVAQDVRLLVVPATQKILNQMIETGTYATIAEAGAVISMPTCGACLGGHMGVLADSERCITSTNRNFRGRMGNPNSEVYLASPKTVAASAIAGYIREAA